MTCLVRDLPLVNRIRIGVASPPVTPPPAPGALVIAGSPDQVVLTAAELAALPAQTRTVTFTAGTGPQTYTETGPTLARVLRAAHIRAALDTWVAAVGSDGYIAAVTPANQSSRPHYFSGGSAISGKHLRRHQPFPLAAAISRLR